jgi:hypothetical protein
MQGMLERLPNTRDLEKAYHALGKQGTVSHEALALYSQWSRLDARLAEIWVLYVFSNWKRYNPIELHEILLRAPWPSAAAVLLEFVDRAMTEKKEDLRIFRHWKRIVVHGIQAAHFEQFFIGQRKVASDAMFEDARFSLAQYKKWGYLSREILFNKQLFPSGKATRARNGRGGSAPHSHEPVTREEVLRSLLERQTRVSIQDYLLALGNSISRRQAERDLGTSRWVRAVGNTRARVYVRR